MLDPARARRAALALGLACLAQAGMPPGAQAGAAGAVVPLQDDARLQRRVTLLHPRIYLGELAEKLAEETSASITVSEERFPAGGIEVCCLARAQPAWRVMQALADLYSSQDARWRWETTRMGGVRRYSLVCGRTPPEAAAALKGRLRRDWEEAAWEQYRVARLPDAERQAAAGRRPELFGQMTRPESWTKYLAAAEFTPQEYARVLRGEHVTVAHERLSAGGRARAEAWYARNRGKPPVQPVRVRAQVFVHEDELMPALSIDAGDGGYDSVLGGWWAGNWLRAHVSDWHGTRDPESLAAIDRYSAAYKRGEARSLGVTRASLEGWLDAVSEVEDVSLLADLDGARGGPPPMTFSFRRGSTPSDTIVCMSRLTNCAWKKSGNIWLLRRLSRFTDSRDYVVSWPMIRQLRTAAASQDGLLGLPELTRIARLRPAQWRGLTEEFPDAERERMERWAPIFRAWNALTPAMRTSLAREKGLRLGDMGIPARSILFPPNGLRPWPGSNESSANPAASVFRLERATVTPRPLPPQRFPPTGVVPAPTVTGPRPAWRWTTLVNGGEVARADFQREPRRPLDVPRQPPARAPADR